MTSLSSANAKPDAFTDAENRRMSLFNRYATLGDEASAMRKRRKALEEEMEAIQNKQVALDHEQVRLGRAAQAAQASTETFHGKIRKLQTEHQQVKDAMDEVTIARDAVRRRRDNMQSEGRLERIRFLELSREFRASCKRLRASALACGLEQASMQAYLETNGVDIHSHDHVDDDKVMLDDDDLDDDPATWKIESNDKELAKRLEIYTNKKQFNDEASDKVQRAEAAKQVIWKQLQSRQAQEDNLQGQAERIAKDNADLEQQIEEMQRLTRDVEQKKAKMLRQRSITNPYAQKKNSSVTPSPAMTARLGNSAKRFNWSATHGSQRDDHDVRCSINTLSDEQRYHIESVALGASSVSLSSRHQTVGGGKRPRRNQTFGSRLQVDGDALPAAFSQDMDGTATPQRATSVLDDDDDDDDDDGALDFVAFGGKKSAK